MTVRDLIDALEEFDENMEVRIGMIQHYGSNFAMKIMNNIAVHNINNFYEEDIQAVVLTEGNKVGTVDYNDEDW